MIALNAVALFVELLTCFAVSHSGPIDVISEANISVPTPYHITPINNVEVCVVGNVIYEQTASIPGSNPCERCICNPPDVVCQTIKCDVKAGCKVIQHPNECCPQFKCECDYNGRAYNNGEKIETLDTPCRVCYCKGGDVMCTTITCYERTDCEGVIAPGTCCPTYQHCPPLGQEDMMLSGKADARFANKRELKPWLYINSSMGSAQNERKSTESYNKILPGNTLVIVMKPANQTSTTTRIDSSATAPPQLDIPVRLQNSPEGPKPLTVAYSENSTKLYTDSIPNSTVSQITDLLGDFVSSATTLGLQKDLTGVSSYFNDLNTTIASNDAIVPASSSKHNVSLVSETSGSGNLFDDLTTEGAAINQSVNQSIVLYPSHQQAYTQLQVGEPEPLPTIEELNTNSDADSKNGALLDRTQNVSLDGPSDLERHSAGPSEKIKREPELYHTSAAFDGTEGQPREHNQNFEDLDSKENVSKGQNVVVHSLPSTVHVWTNVAPLIENNVLKEGPSGSNILSELGTPDTESSAQLIQEVETILNRNWLIKSKHRLDVVNSVVDSNIKKITHNADSEEPATTDIPDTNADTTGDISSTEALSAPKKSPEIPPDSTAPVEESIIQNESNLVSYSENDIVTTATELRNTSHNRSDSSEQVQKDSNHDSFIVPTTNDDLIYANNCEEQKRTCELVGTTEELADPELRNDSGIIVEKGTESPRSENELLTDISTTDAAKNYEPDQVEGTRVSIDSNVSNHIDSLHSSGVEGTTSDSDQSTKQGVHEVAELDLITVGGIPIGDSNEIEDVTTKRIRVKKKNGTWTELPVIQTEKAINSEDPESLTELTTDFIRRSKDSKVESEPEVVTFEAKTSDFGTEAQLEGSNHTDDLIKIVPSSESALNPKLGPENEGTQEDGNDLFIATANGFRVNNAYRRKLEKPSLHTGGAEGQSFDYANFAKTIANESFPGLENNSYTNLSVDTSLVENSDTTENVNESIEQTDLLESKFESVTFDEKILSTTPELGTTGNPTKGIDSLNQNSSLENKMMFSPVVTNILNPVISRLNLTKIPATWLKSSFDVSNYTNEVPGTQGTSSAVESRTEGIVETGTESSTELEEKSVVKEEKLGESKPSVKSPKAEEKITDPSMPYPDTYPDEYQTIQYGPSLIITRTTYTRIPDVTYTMVTTTTLPTYSQIQEAEEGFANTMFETRSHDSSSDFLNKVESKTDSSQSPEYLDQNQPNRGIGNDFIDSESNPNSARNHNMRVSHEADFESRIDLSNSNSAIKNLPISGVLFTVNESAKNESFSTESMNDVSTNSVREFHTTIISYTELYESDSFESETNEPDSSILSEIPEGYSTDEIESDEESQQSDSIDIDVAVEIPSRKERNNEKAQDEMKRAQEENISTLSLKDKDIKIVENFMNQNLVNL